MNREQYVLSHITDSFIRSFVHSRNAYYLSMLSGPVYNPKVEQCAGGQRPLLSWSSCSRGEETDNIQVRTYSK